jgi:hypothetical protein
LKFDRANDELSIACDLWAHQRWFYAEHQGTWYFSNSLVLVHQVAGGNIGVERRAIPYLLIFGYLPGRISPLTGVSVLLPGEVLTVTRGRMRREQRAEMRVERAVTGQGPEDIAPRAWLEAAAGILGHLQEAVRDDLTGVEQVVLPLSGGMDSRFLLGCAMDVLPRDKIVTYTFGDPRTMEQKIATRVAKVAGVEHVQLAMDRRPVEEVCDDGFAHAEGMTYVFPNFPLGPDRKAVLPPGSYVLSGYLGDLVFGAHDVNDRDPAHNTSEYLLKRVHARASGTYLKEALSLLASDRWDELGYEDMVAATPGESLAEKYERWHNQIHCVNRVQYALFVFRHRAFYLTPFVQHKIWNYSRSLPEAVRANERGYFQAMKLGYPVLYAQPTRRNLGLPARMRTRALTILQKTWYRTLNRLDDAAWRSTGRSLYFDPRQLYATRRELRQSQYHAAISDSVALLKQTPAFDPKGLDALLARYRARLPISTHMLRALLTLREWERRYGSTPARAPHAGSR